MLKTVLQIMAGVIPAVFIAAAAFLGGSVLHLMDNMTISDTAQALSQSSGIKESPEVPDTLPDDFYILLLGVDANEDRKTGKDAEAYENTFRSDTIIVAHIDLSNQKVSLCSLERDIKTEIDGYEGYDYKLNAAYALGGVDLMRTEAEQLTGTLIPYYAIVDIDGMTDIVDALGGVEVDVEKVFYDEKLHDGIDEAGLQTLTGSKAMTYARSRMPWESGDYDRARHQRAILASIADKVSDSDILSLYRTVESMSDRISTNLSLLQIFEIAAKLRGIDAANDIYSMMTPAEDAYIDGVSYQVLDKYEWEKILSDFISMTNPKEREEDDQQAVLDRTLDDDGDGYYDADENLDGVVDDMEWARYLSQMGLAGEVELYENEAGEMSGEKSTLDENGNVSSASAGTTAEEYYAGRASKN